MQEMPSISTDMKSIQKGSASAYFMCYYSNICSHHNVVNVVPNGATPVVLSCKLSCRLLLDDDTPYWSLY